MASNRFWRLDTRLAGDDVTDGIENIRSAYEKLFTGGNIGKMLVKI